jgi:glycosidase
MPLPPNAPWWKTGVIYQIYPRSFKDTTGNGVGDLRGVIEKLDYLGDTLGVDALWLSPFYPSPMADFGYDVSDYTDVHPLFGDLATFDELVAKAHGRGLKVIIDVVPNHTSEAHPWFVESRASRHNPRRDWYVWRDPAPDGGPPNNWLSVFGGPAWEWDETTGQYYLHSFLKEQPDLNWRNPEVREAMFEVFRFWLERDVDGFRIDVAHFIMKDPLERDNPPNPRPGEYHKDMGAYDTQLHLYDKGHEDVHGVFRDLRRLLDAYSRDHERFAVGEIHLYDWDAWVRYYGENLDELHMPFNFALLRPAWEARAVRAVVDGLEAALPEGAWPNYVLGNHDETRIAGRYGRAPSRVAAVLLLTLRGTPTLYYGDELGLEEVDVPPEKRQDPWGLRVPGLGRDGCRTPMPWDASHAAGFTTADEPWLPLNDDYETVNVAAERADPRSMLSLYRRLLALRKNTRALHAGDYRPLDDAPPHCFAYLRQADDETVMVALNFSAEPVRVPLSSPGRGRLLLSSHLDRDDEPLREHVSLRGHEAVIIAL